MINIEYRTRSNLWNVLIIGTPNLNHLIRSNSWNEWIFEINNHSNRSNGQVLLSFIFSCYNVSRSYYQFLPMERYVAGNVQFAWRAPSSSAYNSPPWVRKCQSKRPRRICRSTRARVYSWWWSIWLQRGMFTPGSLHNVSYRRDFCVSCGVDIVTNWSILLFSVAVQLLLTRAKPF